MPPIKILKARIAEELNQQEVCESYFEGTQNF